MQERVYKTQAIVLRRFDFGETGRQLIAFTPDFGKISLIAKGTKKPTSKLAGHLEPLTLTQLVVASGRNIDTVTQAQTIKSFANVRSDSRVIPFGLIVAELLDRMIAEGEPNREIWALAVDTLERLNNTNDPWKPVTYFQVRLLILAGYQPELKVCSRCGQDVDPESVYFSLSAGGMVCRECSKGDPTAVVVSPNVIKALRLASLPSYEVFEKVRIPQDLRLDVEAIIRRIYAHILESDIRSIAMLRTFYGTDEI